MPDHRAEARRQVIAPNSIPRLTAAGLPMLGARGVAAMAIAAACVGLGPVFRFGGV